MALWGMTDAEVSRPKHINLNNYPAGTQLVFVDATEAATETNKSKGIKGPGWYLYNEYTDSDGQVRYKTELVVAMSIAAADAGDAVDDLTVPDVEVLVAITAQPTDQTAVAGAATFSVTATLNPAGTLTYQWQSKAAGATRWSNVTGATSTSLALTGLVEADSGTQYRVVVGGAGAKKVTSSSATLTVLPA